MLVLHLPRLVGLGLSLALKKLAMNHRGVPDVGDHLVDLSGGGGSTGLRPRLTEHVERQPMRSVCRWREQVLQVGGARPMTRRGGRLKRRCESGSRPVGRSSAWRDGGCPQG
jgi:hypothetical protein